MTKNKFWIFLEELRKSGETNMYGAAPYLMREFKISYHEAVLILVDWMQHYDRNDYE